MQQHRLTGLKLHGLGIIEKVHETKTFRHLGEKQALLVQNKARKSQPLCKSRTVLWHLFREKGQMSMDQQIGTLSNLQKDRKPITSEYTHDIFIRHFLLGNKEAL